MYYVSMTIQVVDLFTKALPSDQFHWLCTLLKHGFIVVFFNWQVGECKFKHANVKFLPNGSFGWTLGENMVKCTIKSTCKSTCQVNKK